MSKQPNDKWSLKQLRAHTDPRGSLIALESQRDVPFSIERVYYLYGIAPGAERGFHAHRRLQQMAICLSGSCTFVMDDGRERREIRLDCPDRALYIGELVWHEMRDFSRDCVLLVFAGAPYDEADYIHSFDEFVALVKAGDYQ